MSHKPVSFIDTHHHISPGFFADAVRAAGGDPAGYSLPVWDPAASEAWLDANSGTTAILSLSAPGAAIAGNQNGACRLARQANNYCAQIRDSKPGRFGFFGAVPDALDTVGTLREIAYAFDVLGADGITLFTRYGDGNYYLGHRAFLPVWEELNRRHAVVFVHPTHAVDTNQVNPGLHGPAIDYPHETTRTAVDMIMNRTLQRHPNAKVILSHAGGNLPWIIPRLAMAVRDAPPSSKGGITYEDWMGNLRRFYYDLALSSSQQGLDLLLKVIPNDHILYGKPTRFSFQGLTLSHPPSILIIFGPVGLLMWGLGLGNHLHPMVPIAGVGITYGVLCAGTAVALTYVVDSYRSIAGESATILIAFRNTFAFGLSFAVYPWLELNGFNKVTGFGRFLVDEAHCETCKSL